MFQKGMISIGKRIANSGTVRAAAFAPQSSIAAFLTQQTRKLSNYHPLGMVRARNNLSFEIYLS